jgi:hypothetical protein
MNKEVVKVIGDENNSAVHTSTNPEYGYIRVQQATTTFNNGWMRPEIRTALIHGKLEDLMNAEFKPGMELPGKIVVKEGLVPFTSNAQKELKVAGETGVVCRVDDQPIYRTSYYTSNPNEQDVLIQHTNGEEIREKALQIKETQKLTEPKL